MKNHKNIGTVDRVIRIAAGATMLLLAPLALTGPEYGWALFGLFGVIPLVAGVIGYCPPYALLGINTYHGTRTQGDYKRRDHRESACC